MKTPLVSKRLSSVISGTNDLIKVWDLPKFPFTEFFGEYQADFPVINQALMMCPQSGVFQLQNEVDPYFLYNAEGYNFKTVSSPKIIRELEFFLNNSKLYTYLSPDSRILEIGGNNQVMANLLRNSCKEYAICDPVVSDESNENVSYWKGLIEENLSRVEDFQPTIIMGRHVLEHINFPLKLVRDIIEKLRKPAIFVFEFPNFRLIQKRQRLDAIFHQHLNYFDENSIKKFIYELDCNLLNLTNNYEGSNGGSLIVTFESKPSFKTNDVEVGLNHVEAQLNSFKKALSLFVKQTESLQQQIDQWDGEVFGFGAGLMLSTLNYHLNGAVEKLQFIADDDLSKVGAGYKNLRLRIENPLNLRDNADNLILITSMENQRAILNRLRSYPKSNILSFNLN